MDAIHLREIFLSVEQNVKCPKCSTKLDHRSIDLISDSDTSCQMKMECPHCKLKFGGRAQMLSAVTPEGRKLNASSVLPVLKQKQMPLVEKDKEVVHGVMEIPHFSFSELFKMMEEEKVQK